MCVHHADCDGWRMHSVEAVRLPDGTWKPSCPLCGILPVIGAAGSRETALALGRGHERSVRCVGECGGWV